MFDYIFYLCLLSLYTVYNATGIYDNVVEGVWLLSKPIYF